MERSDLRGEDIIVSLCAREECVPGKRVDYYSKECRNYYAFHYIVSGNGTLTYGGKTVPLKAGDLFIIPPLADISYCAVDRWEYYWVNVEGKMAPAVFKSIGLDENRCRVGYRPDSNLVARFSELVNYFYIENDAELRCRGMFYLLIGDLYQALHEKVGRLSDPKRNADYYIREAETFLKYNLYYTGITLDSVAKSVSVNKNYLCTVFSKKIGVSPMQYLTKLRMEAAAKRLEETDESVAVVARYVGYKDPLHFSKSFRAYHGLSPSKYREQFAE